MGEMFTRQSKTTHTTINIERYNSVADIAADCASRKITDKKFDNMREKSLRANWHGVNSYDEAINLLRNGYAPVVDELKTALKCQRTGTRKRTRVYNNVTGFAPVVPLALMGVPNAMLDKKTTRIKNKVINIYYDTSYSCGTSSREIIENGKNILSAMVKLEEEGYAINAYTLVAFADKNMRTADMVIAKIKSSNQPLDLTKMSFALTHSAFQRVIAFDWYSKSPRATYRDGYGVPIAARVKGDRLTKFAHDIFGESAVYICGRNILDKGVDEIREVLLNDSGNMG